MTNLRRYIIIVVVAVASNWTAIWLWYLWHFPEVRNFQTKWIETILICTRFGVYKLKLNVNHASTVHWTYGFGHVNRKCLVHLIDFKMPCIERERRRNSLIEREGERGKERKKERVSEWVEKLKKRSKKKETSLNGYGTKCVCMCALCTVCTSCHVSSKSVIMHFTCIMKNFCHTFLFVTHALSLSRSLYRSVRNEMVEKPQEQNVCMKYEMNK